MKRREFIERAALIGGIAVLQPWQLVKMIGASDPANALNRLLDWGIRAEAGTVPINYVSRPFKVVAGADLRTGMANVTTNAATAGDGTSSFAANADLSKIKNGGSSNLVGSLNPGTITQVHDLRITLSQPLVMDQCPTIGMRYYAPAGLNNMTLLVSNDTSSVNRFQFGVNTQPGVSTNLQWSFLQWHRDEWSFSNGSPNWQSDLLMFRLQPSSGAGFPANVYLDQFFYDGYQRPVIVWIFDGGFSTHYSAVFGAWTAKGITGTIAIPTSLIDQPGYLTSGQIDEMYAAGWDVLHMSDSASALTGLTVAQVETRLLVAESVMRAKGWTRTIKHMCLPGTSVSTHRSDTNVRQALLNLGYESAIDKWGDGAPGNDVNPTGIDPEYGISLSPYSVPAWRTENPDVLAEHQRHVRHAIKAGGPRLLRSGSVVPSTVSGQLATADHAALLNEVALYHHAGTLSAYPYRKFIAGLSGRVIRS